MPKPEEGDNEEGRVDTVRPTAGGDPYHAATEVREIPSGILRAMRAAKLPNFGDGDAQGERDGSPSSGDEAASPRSAEKPIAKHARPAAKAAPAARAVEPVEAVEPPPSIPPVFSRESTPPPDRLPPLDRPAPSRPASASEEAPLSGPFPSPLAPITGSDAAARADRIALIICGAAVLFAIVLLAILSFASPSP